MTTGWVPSIDYRSKTCAVCSGPMTLHQQLTGETCFDPLCRDTWRRHTLDRQRAPAAEAMKEAAPEAYELLILPSGPRRSRNVPEKRRRRLRHFISGLLGPAAVQRAKRAGRKAAAAPVHSVALNGESSSELAVLGQGCAVCKGHCCPQGKDKAFLTVDTIERYMAEHPERRPRDVLEAYLARIPQRHAEGSCLYHTRETGCALPREMRSDTCNRYYCVPLESLREKFAETARPQAFVVATGQFDRPVRVGFMHEDGLRVRELPEG